MAEYIAHEHDVVIIGAGGAGLRAAVEASAAGARVAVITKSLLGKAHTVMAEGFAKILLHIVQSTVFPGEIFKPGEAEGRVQDKAPERRERHVGMAAVIFVQRCRQSDRSGAFHRAEAKQAARFRIAHRCRKLWCWGDSFVQNEVVIVPVAQFELRVFRSDP